MLSSEALLFQRVTNRMCVCVCLFVCMCLFVCVCMCVRAQDPVLFCEALRGLGAKRGFRIAGGEQDRKCQRRHRGKTETVSE